LLDSLLQEIRKTPHVLTFQNVSQGIV